MLKTPNSFTSLVAAQTHPAPVNFVFCGDELLVQEADLALPSAQALAWLGLQAAQFHPVGLLGDLYCQTCWISTASVHDLSGTGLALRKLRSLFGVMDEGLLSVAGRAFQISNWARTHQFCGACGTPTVHLGGERCVKCPACGFMAYPRISPAMMVLIKHGNSILLARHKASPAPFFTALAGFVEAGESVEEAIHREVFEEVGLKVRDLAYFASQPWPFPHSLMIAYTAEFESGDIKIDEAEIAEARWFGPGDVLPKIPFGVSIASDLIRAHLPGVSPAQKLPADKT
jgi:NAD+ diphosphatase